MQVAPQKLMVTTISHIQETAKCLSLCRYQGLGVEMAVFMKRIQIAVVSPAET